MFWTILFFILILIEAFIGDFTALTISTGALAAAGFAFLDFNLAIQIIAFTVVSSSFLIFLRPYLRTRLTPVHKDFTAGSFIGETAEVIDKIEDNKRGRIKIGSEIWFAESSSNIEVGEKVIILEINSAIMKVVPKDEVINELDEIIDEKNNLKSNSNKIGLEKKNNILEEKREEV